MINVFYDGHCGMCRREISYYQRIANPGIFDWQDISRSTDVLLARGVTLEEGLKTLHVEDHAGQMHRGVAAFIVIWQHLPRPWPFLARLLRMPCMLALTEKLYGAFATWRFRRLDYGTCIPPHSNSGNPHA